MPNDRPPYPPPSPYGAAELLPAQPGRVTLSYSKSVILRVIGLTPPSHYRVIGLAPVVQYWIVDDRRDGK
jgi:hypothetical protein